MSTNSFDIDDNLLLVRAICQQDRRALATLYLKYSHQIRSYISSHVIPIDDTEDLVQDVFIQLLEGKGHYDRSKSVEPYIIGITKNIIHRYFRQKRRWAEISLLGSRKDSSLSYHIRQSQSSRLKVSKHQLKRIIEDMEAQLSTKEQEALMLKFIDGLLPREAAKKAGCSIGAFYKRLERATKILRDASVRTE